MNKVARNHDVSGQNIRLDYGILLRGCPISRFFSHSMVV